jgi:hypothetical protein
VSEADWSWQGLVVTRTEARVLEYAVNAWLANEDVEPAFFVGDLAAETALTRGGTLRGALRRLVERGWLSETAEDGRVASFEGRPPRVYFLLTAAGAEAVEALVGPRRGWIPRPS